MMADLLSGPLLVGLCTASATIAGGALAIRFRARLATLLAFSSGAVVGVALLDLLPQAIRLGAPVDAVPAIVATMAGGLGLYLLLDRLLAWAASRHRGRVGPASLALHSLIDGLGIGLAFQVSTVAGVIVAIAVLAHDLLDGANTVLLTLAGGGNVASARRWLALDALAPFAGMLLARLVPVSPALLAYLLAFFAGGFLYIGAARLLPGSGHAAHGPTRAVAVVLGAAFIAAIVRLAGA